MPYNRALERKVLHIIGPPPYGREAEELYREAEMCVRQLCSSESSHEDLLDRLLNIGASDHLVSSHLADSAVLPFTQSTASSGSSVDFLKLESKVWVMKDVLLGEVVPSHHAVFDSATEVARAHSGMSPDEMPPEAIVEVDASGVLATVDSRVFGSESSLDTDASCDSAISLAGLSLGTCESSVGGVRVKKELQCSAGEALPNRRFAQPETVSPEQLEQLKRDASCVVTMSHGRVVATSYGSVVASKGKEKQKEGGKKKKGKKAEKGRQPSAEEIVNARFWLNPTLKREQKKKQATACRVRARNEASKRP